MPYRGKRTKSVKLADGKVIRVSKNDHARLKDIAGKKGISIGQAFLESRERFTIEPEREIEERKEIPRVSGLIGIPVATRLFKGGPAACRDPRIPRGDRPRCFRCGKSFQTLEEYKEHLSEICPAYALEFMPGSSG